MTINQEYPVGSVWNLSIATGEAHRLYSPDEGSISGLEWDERTRCAFFVVTGYVGTSYMRLCQHGQHALPVNVTGGNITTLAWASTICSGNMSVSSGRSIHYVSQDERILGIEVPSGQVVHAIPVQAGSMPAMLACDPERGLMGITPPSVVQVGFDGSMDVIFTGPAWMRQRRPDFSIAWEPSTSTLLATCFVEDTSTSIVWAANLQQNTSRFVPTGFLVSGLASTMLT